jgi:hypothetical protein
VSPRKKLPAPIELLDDELPPQDLEPVGRRKFVGLQSEPQVSALRFTGDLNLLQPLNRLGQISGQNETVELHLDASRSESANQLAAGASNEFVPKNGGLTACFRLHGFLRRSAGPAGPQVH